MRAKSTKRFFGKSKNARQKIVKKRPAKVRKEKSKPIPVFNNRFSGALSSFGIAFLESTGIVHNGIKGSQREKALRTFLMQRLPKRFGVTTGEVVDQTNNASQQLDVLIYDQMRNFSFSDGEEHILPAEALLVSIEVKSRLTADEIKKCINSSRKLRSLKPFKLSLGGAILGTDKTEQARYLHCVFAYDSDLVDSDDWMAREYQRFQSCADQNEHTVDIVYVLKRGLLNFPHKKGRREDSDGSAITSFYFTILNFLEREGNRRKATPYEGYASLLKGRWTELE